MKPVKKITVEMAEKLYIARVTIQREKTNALGKWITRHSFSNDIHEAQLFTSESQILARLPLFWEVEVFEIAVPAAASFSLYREGHASSIRELDPAEHRGP